jgi:hypothetical protein
MTDRSEDAPGPEISTAGGGDGGGTPVTGADAGTARGEFDHHGDRRTGSEPSDAGATDEAARELAEDDESEPTRSE